MIYYVNVAAPAGGNGSKEKPFNKIQNAADLAQAGDEVIVAPGIYREAVNPKNAGKPGKPIIYRSEKMLAAHITGAEPAKNGKKLMVMFILHVYQMQFLEILIHTQLL